MTRDNIPLVILPGQSGEYKIVQFECDNQAYLRFGNKPERKDHHEFILERFAKEIGVQCAEIPGPCGPVSALPDTIFYKMSGAGICAINLEERLMYFSGTSFDYRKGINQDHLQKLRIQLQQWNIE